MTTLADRFKKRFQSAFRLPNPVGLEMKERADLGVLRVDDAMNDPDMKVVKFTDGSAVTIRPHRRPAAEIRKDPA